MTDKFVKNGEISLHYIVANFSPVHLPVVFIPGALVSAEEFYEYIKNRLDQYFIIISHRGVGKSNIPLSGYSKDDLVSDIRSVVKNEMLEKYFIGGHSFGSAIASAYSVKYPEDINGLILGDYPPGYPEYPEKWAEQAIINNPGVNENLVYGLQRESIYEMYIKELSKSCFKILLLKGNNEGSLLKPKLTEKILTELNNCILKKIANSGHELFADNPEDTLNAIKLFTESTKL